MKYYVVSDVHGFLTPLKKALEEKGFFNDTEPHKLIICGDVYDRGFEAREMQEFLLELMDRDELILIKGNHEELLLDLLEDFKKGRNMIGSHHESNMTIDTVLQLTGKDRKTLVHTPLALYWWMQDTPTVKRILPSAVDYFETEHYVFVHGWLPRRDINVFRGREAYALNENWREAPEEYWHDARWLNGLEAAYNGAILKDKTVVCGHIHTSFGHARYEGIGTEFYSAADFSPYYALGIIALDACTVYSEKVNCIVIEDEEVLPSAK